MDGQVQGRRIEATAKAPRGLRFGSFDRSDFSTPDWGSVSIDFDDCNNGVLSWNSVLPEFGSGTTDLRRLTRIEGSHCVLEADAPGPVGLVDVSVDSYTGPFASEWPDDGIGAIDPDGRIWALETGDWFEQSPMAGFNGEIPCVALGSLERLEGDAALAQLGAMSNNWTASERANHNCMGTPYQGIVNANLFHVQVSASPTQYHRRWRMSPRANATLLAPLSMEVLVRDYQVSLRGSASNVDVSLSIQADGQVCLGSKQRASDPVLACGLHGRIWLTDPQAGFFNFELADVQRPHASPYRGRGWIESRKEGERLILIGQNPARGLGVVAR